MALHVRGEALPYSTAIVTTRLVPTSQVLSSIVGIPVAPNKAVVGANAFAHESGIHQDGLLKDRRTYEIMTPEMVGARGTRLVLGKHSGMRGLDARCRALGHRLGEADLERVYRRVTELADRSKTVSDDQLAAIVGEEAAVTPTAVVPRRAAVAAGQGAAWR